MQENLKAASELRALREEQASWEGQLDLAQTKYGLAEKELRARDSALVEVSCSARPGLTIGDTAATEYRQVRVENT